MSARPKRSSAGANCAASSRGRPRTLPPSSKLCSKLFTLFLGLCGALSACAEENYELGAVPDLGTPQELRESVNFPSKVNTELLAPTEGTAHGAAVPTGAPLPQGAPAAQGEQAGPSAPKVNAPAVSPQSLLQNSKNLKYERKLHLQHAQLVERYRDNFAKLGSGKQPANKTEACLVSTDLLDGIGDDKSLIFWEGSCQNGLAEGFGRVYVVDSGRKTFELLGNFHSDEPQFTTIYYAKNTTVQSQTIYFYGKANSYQSSGITINSNHVSNDLVVSLQFVDKVNLVTYQKEISKNSKYVLNIEDFGNYVHLIHDLSNTPYSTLSMSYRLRDRSTNEQLGYSFTGLANGMLQGRYRDEQGNEHPVEVLPEDVLRHINRVNEYVDVNIESCIENVIKAVPVIDAYLQVICAPTYSDAVCERMKCKQMCEVGSTITPEDSAVKALLLRLVEHHNAHPLRAYLAQAIDRSQMLARSQQQDAELQGTLNLQQQPDSKAYIIATEPVQVAPQEPAPVLSSQEARANLLNQGYTAPIVADRSFPDLEQPPAIATQPTQQNTATAMAPNSAQAPATLPEVQELNAAASDATVENEVLTLDDILLPADADADDIAAAQQRLNEQQAEQAAARNPSPYVATERTTLTQEEQRIRQDIIDANINHSVDATPEELLPSAN